MQLFKDFWGTLSINLNFVFCSRLHSWFNCTLYKINESYTIVKITSIIKSFVISDLLEIMSTNQVLEGIQHISSLKDTVPKQSERGTPVHCNRWLIQGCRQRQVTDLSADNVVHHEGHSMDICILLSFAWSVTFNSETTWWLLGIRKWTIQY